MSNPYKQISLVKIKMLSLTLIFSSSMSIFRSALADRLGEPLNRDQEEEDAMNKPVLSRVIKVVTALFS